MALRFFLVLSALSWRRPDNVAVDEFLMPGVDSSRVSYSALLWPRGPKPTGTGCSFNNTRYMELRTHLCIDSMSIRSGPKDVCTWRRVTAALRSGPTVQTRSPKRCSGLYTSEVCKQHLMNFKLQEIVATTAPTNLGSTQIMDDENLFEKIDALFEANSAPLGDPW